MTPEEDKHRAEIARDFATSMFEKYKKGTVEHKGKIWRKPTMDFMAEEIIDMYVYYHVHRQHMESVKILLKDALEKYDKVGDDSVDLAILSDELTNIVRDALNVLEVGNMEGITEEGD